MHQHSQVLELGCGALSLGRHLIEYLAPAHYVGVDPAGWTVEAALGAWPQLDAQAPTFLWRSDFDAAELGRDFDFVVAHSVLSHMAHWQLPQMLANTRAVVDDGAVFLCSYRRGEMNTLAADWTYPGVTQFRLGTLKVQGSHAGWRVEQMPDLQRRLREVAPNDIHDWLRLVAVDSAAALNDLRLAEEELEREEQEARDRHEAERRRQAEEEHGR
jgi:cyclopropane fatty-acyl-phospholipid synthase-like methyltransferase